MGDWRSWLARLTGSQKVTGSNPVFSTIENNSLKVNYLRLRELFFSEKIEKYFLLKSKY